MQHQLTFVAIKIHQNNHLHCMAKNKTLPRKNALIFNKIVVQLETFAVRDEQFSQIFFAAPFFTDKGKNRKFPLTEIFYDG